MLCVSKRTTDYAYICLVACCCLISPLRQPLNELEDFVYAVGVNSGTAPGAVFRRPLTDFDDVPDVVFNSIAFLDKHALYAQGLFRVPVRALLD